jgi:periplasmic divalent cation tolerance protein
MSQDHFVMVYCPCQSPEEAGRLGKQLLEQKLAACINVLPEVQSAYWFEGKIQEDRESLLIVKTSSDFRESVVNTIKKNHSYSVPAIMSWEANSENSAFTELFKETLRP